MMKSAITIVLCLLVISASAQFPLNGFLTKEAKKSNFPLSTKGKNITILISADEHPGVKRAAEWFKMDLEAVTGNSVDVISTLSGDLENLIIVGSLDKSSQLKALKSAGKFSEADLKGSWEKFVISQVKKPMTGVQNALVIAGSDKRGAIFGMLELSRQMGVSPWHYWADVPAQSNSEIYVKSGRHTLGEPDVKYRGIFINDEAPALRNWAEETFGGFNHKFYEKVFELILRNRGNYLWPAMWRPTAFADDDPENARLADELGVVISTSHHEPMMRAHDEWSRYNGGAWNYETNKEQLTDFWRGGIERMGDFESVVTVGMRGDGDEAMSEGTAVDLMKEIIKGQREIIADVTRKPAKETAQVWAIYKEVQDYYDKGMRVDDDILVLLCDDNWGNVRILPKKEDLGRSGGYGMYYHFDFVGGPVSYRWLNVTQIERVWEQMNLAYEWGVRDLWIVNVGDIKPMELPISFFLDFAWNTDINAADLPEYYAAWATQQFGQTYGQEIGEIVSLSTRYSARRTPEMLKPDTYSLINYREADRVLEDYNKLLIRSKAVQDKLSEDYKSAYYQLVHHPIEVLQNLNEMYVAAGKNRMYADQGRASANIYADRVKKLFFQDEEIARFYHQELAGGKWNHMMSQTRIGYTSWNNPSINRMPDVTYIQVPNSARLGYVVEHGTSQSRWVSGGLYSRSFSTFDPINDQHYYLELFNGGAEKLNFTIEPQNDWIRVSTLSGSVDFEQKVDVSIDWSKAPKVATEGKIVIAGANQRFEIAVPIRNDIVKPVGFVENNGVVSIEAANFSRKVDAKGISWTTVPNMGRTSSSLTMEPANAEPQTPTVASPYVEYVFTLLDAAEVSVDAYLAPTLNFKKNEGLKYAISFDNETPQIINMHEGELVPDWEYPDWWNKSVTDRVKKKQSVHGKMVPGVHTLKVWMVDPGVVFQKFVIDCGGVKPSYLGPPQSVQIK